jgi:hypothetical protein
MRERETGLPSMIQAGSIGRSSRSTSQLPVSIKVRDICSPKGYNMTAGFAPELFQKLLGTLVAGF